MIALILLAGFGAGAVMTLAAGARRTDSAYPRFARAYKAADMLVYPSFGGGQFAQFDFDTLARRPEVAAASVQHFLFGKDTEFAISVDQPPYGVDIDRYKILAGRRAQAADEIMVPYWTAKNNRWHVGSIVTISVGLATTPPSFAPVRYRVVGIEAAPGEFPPQISGNTPGGGGDAAIHISPAGFTALQSKKAFFLDFLMLRFKRGAAENQHFNNVLNDMAINPETGEHIAQLNDNLNEQASNVQRSIHLQAVALWLVAGLAALIIVLVLSQLIARQAALDSVDAPTLLALGMTRTQVWFSGMGRALVIGSSSAVIAVVASYLASGLMPVGTARIAEPVSGLSFDVRLLAFGVVVVVALVLLLAAWPVWKNARAIRTQAPPVAKPGFAARTVAAPAFTPAVATGVRFALESGRGRTEVPVRSSLVSVILAVAALASALTFGASLNHLLNTPRLYGWNWDVHLTTTGDNQDNRAAIEVLKPDPRVEDIAALDSPPLILNDKLRFDIVGLNQVKGRIEPVLINGRLPELPTEVGLGVKTMRDAHVKIGDTVRLHVSAIADSPDAAFTIVGSVVLPPNSDTARLGSGAALTEQGVERMVPPHFTIPASSDLYLKFAPGVNEKVALADVLQKNVTVRFVDDEGRPQVVVQKLNQAYAVLKPAKPSDLVNFGQVQDLPLLLAGLVGVLAAATLAHTLVTSIRRRRRDLAILKILGFVPRQIRTAVAWQATTFVCAALAIGLPVGIAAGRVIWSAFATNLGTVPEPVTPSLRLLLTIPGAILLANLIAAAPAVVAGRLRPAPALRAE